MFFVAADTGKRLGEISIVEVFGGVKKGPGDTQQLNGRPKRRKGSSLGEDDFGHRRFMVK
jgi:hypothetical protein